MPLEAAALCPGRPVPAPGCCLGTCLSPVGEAQTWRVAGSPGPLPEALGPAPGPVSGTQRVLRQWALCFWGPYHPPSRKLEALRLVVTRWFSCPVSSCSSESELYIQAPPGCVPTQAPSPRHSESRPQPTRCSPLQSLLPASEPGASHKSRERTHALPLEFTNPGWCSVRMSDARASPTRPQGALLATQHPPAALQLVPGPCTQAALLP